MDKSDQEWQRAWGDAPRSCPDCEGVPQGQSWLCPTCRGERTIPRWLAVKLASAAVTEAEASSRRAYSALRVAVHGRDV